MKTKEFVNLLRENKDLSLNFQIESNKSIAPTFHITEIKNVSIESVDCGGNLDRYKQTVVQLWVNPSEKLRSPWSAGKALSIFEIVNDKTAIDLETEIFFEYGDDKTRTSHFSVQELSFKDGQIEIDLFAKPTVCKPQLVDASACCTPGGGCC